MSSRSAAEFESSLILLTTDLAERAKDLRKYALTCSNCTRCRSAQEWVWLASAEEAAAHPHGTSTQVKPQVEQRVSVVPGFGKHRSLVAASDAAYKGRFGGLGFVVSDGHYGMKHWPPDAGMRLLDPSGQSKVLVAELRAAAMAIKALGDRAGKASLLLDSSGAIAYLRSWQKGDVERMPAGYSLRPRMSGARPTLVSLAAKVAKLPMLRIEHVKGHTGHPLNEAADALADIAMRNPADRHERAEGVVDAFLRAWHGRSLR